MTRPFLKWPGGKRWLVPVISRIVKDWSITRYLEPFLGGGAVFFGLSPRTAHLSDINGDLINTYIQVRDHPKELIGLLQSLPVDAKTYLRLRSFEPSDTFERAVRFLYLNRTGFGGMYRLNRQGRFNVPYGNGDRTPEPLWRDGLILNASSALKATDLSTADFDEAISKAGEGDLIYCDPTYTVTHSNNGFRRYNEKNFSWADQVRLAESCVSSSRRGAIVLVSNAHSTDVGKLYPDARVLTVQRKSLLCPDKAHRGIVNEYVFVLGPDEVIRSSRALQDVNS